MIGSFIGKPIGGVLTPAIALALTARCTAQATVRAAGGIALPGRMRASVALRTPGGVAFGGGKVTVASTARVQNGVAFSAKVKAQVSAKLPGGVNLPSVLHAAAGGAVQFGYILPGVIRTAAALRTALRVSLPSSIKAALFGVGGRTNPGGLTLLPPGGSGRRYDDDVLPTPPYGVKPAKKFRPIWDEIRRRKLLLQRERETFVPLPPQQIYEPRPLPPQPIPPGTLPQPVPQAVNFTPADPLGIEQRLRNARDMTDIAQAGTDLNDLQDALNVIAGLGLIHPDQK